MVPIQRRSFPNVLFIKRADGTGYGFLYASPEDFNAAAHVYSGPIDARIQKEAKEKGTAVDGAALRKKAAFGAIQKVFEPGWDDAEGITPTRCVAASCIKESSWRNGIPLCVVMEDVGNDVHMRSGAEFEEHPGYPLALIEGRKDGGGGTARFFDSGPEYLRFTKKPMTADLWVPQAVFKLYKRTPSVMLAGPRASSKDPETKADLEIRAVSINGQGKLVRRT